MVHYFHFKTHSIYNDARTNERKGEINYFSIIIIHIKIGGKIFLKIKCRRN